MEAYEYEQKASLPLELKVTMTKNRIRDFYNAMDGDVYVGFSGGKDSTVLLDIVRSMYPEVPAVFVDTGLEYPEIREFVKTFDNIEILKPSMSFKSVIEKYGLPYASKLTARKIEVLQNPTDRNVNSRHLYTTGYRMDGKHSPRSMLAKKHFKLIDSKFKISNKCCDIMKKLPFHEYHKKTGLYPFIGTMASDSDSRKVNYLKYGCNSFEGKNISSKPLSIWTTANVWEYIKEHQLSYASVYDTGVTNTGCMFCMFGIFYDGTPNRFQIMKETHPKQYDYCINKLGIGELLDFTGYNY